MYPYYGQPYYGAAGLDTQPSFAKKVNAHKSAKESSSAAAPERKITVGGLLTIIVAPWFVFVVVLYARAMGIRYFYPWLSLALALYFLAMVCVAGVMTYSAARDAKNGNPYVLGLIFILCAAGFFAAWSFGQSIYVKFTQPYYDVNNLNAYPSVDPVNSLGNQYMDAGIIDFKAEATLDLARSIGFRDSSVYCVAPITMPDATTTHLDFWAVGINCCGNGQGPSPFKCGEYNIPGVHGGLRLLSDEQRSFYRLAVKEAEASFGLVADHPVFVHWMADPSGEAEAYQRDAISLYMSGVFISLAVTVFAAIFVGMFVQCTSK